MRDYLCWEIFDEICKFLSLNDAINAFSTGILFFSKSIKSKSAYCQTLLLNTIVHKINPEQIVSLCLNKDENWLKVALACLPMFNQVIWLTLLIPHFFEQISEYEPHFSNRTCLYQMKSVLLSSEINSMIWNSLCRCVMHGRQSSFSFFESVV
jgi:hypothetical protein